MSRRAAAAVLEADLAHQNRRGHLVAPINDWAISRLAQTTGPPQGNFCESRCDRGQWEGVIRYAWHRGWELSLPHTVQQSSKATVGPNRASEGLRRDAAE